MRRVLRWYVVHNPQIGYCQSMNVLCGVLIAWGFAEDDVFYFMDSLIYEVCNGYHTWTLEKLMVDMNVLEKLMQEFTPQ